MLDVYPALVVVWLEQHKGGGGMVGCWVIPHTFFKRKKGKKESRPEVCGGQAERYKSRQGDPWAIMRVQPAPAR
jgi:hypothetical protein